MGTPSRGYGGVSVLSPTQRRSQTSAAASELLAKSPSLSLDAVSITLMWASTIQTWANIILM